MKVYQLRDIIPLINEQGLSLEQVAFKVNKSLPTIWRWVKILRDNGYEIKTKKGRKALKI